ALTVHNASSALVDDALAAYMRGLNSQDRSSIEHFAETLSMGDAASSIARLHASGPIATQERLLQYVADLGREGYLPISVKTQLYSIQKAFRFASNFTGSDWVPDLRTLVVAISDEGLVRKLEEEIGTPYPGGSDPIAASLWAMLSEGNAMP